MFLLHLRRNRRGVGFVRVGLLFSSWADLNAALAAVKGNVVFVVHNHCAVNVYIGDCGCVYMHDGGVVEESAATPLAAAKSYPPVSEAVVNAAIEADLRPPIATVPCIDAIVPSPVPGSPEEPRSRRLHPR